MPTGYTAYVEDGRITSLRDFAFLCARAFGACITMRDEPLSKPIPEQFVPETKYYTERLETARKQLEQFNAMSDDEAVIEYEKDYAECLRGWQERDEKRMEETERYRSMISKVEAWKDGPHELKGFMLSQLRQSIYEYEFPAPSRISPLEWKRHNIERAQKDIEYFTKNIDQEIERTEARNKWLSDLRKSLEGIE